MDSAFPLAVKAVMIDLDGTLLDTVPDLAAAANMMLKEIGRPALPEEVIRTFVGKGITNLVDRAIAGHIDGTADPELHARGLEIYERCYTQANGRRATLYPGVVEGLERMQAQGFALACVTNKSGRYTLPLLDMMGLAPYFEHVVAGDTVSRKKPDPAPLLYACGKLGVMPHEMLMVGDSLNDTIAARAAGCPVFCVTYGYNEGRDVRSLDTNAIIDSLVEAAALIKRA